MANINPFLSHAATAAIAAGIAVVCVTGADMQIIKSAVAQVTAANRTVELLKQPLSDLPGREVRILMLNRPAGDASPPHHHPGHHTFGVVIEGEYEFGVDNGPTKILKPGETFYEPIGAVHSVSRNPSKDKDMKVLVFMVANQTNISTEPVKQ